MDVTIQYNNGKMTICVDEFLKMRNLRKFKKLMKIIRTSYTPEIEDEIKEYMERRIPDFEQQTKWTENAFVSAQTKQKEAMEEVDRLQRECEYLVKGLPRYKEKMEKLKLAKDSVKYWKAESTSLKREFEKLKRIKEFCEKCLEI